MNNILAALHGRKSVRSYLSKSISAEDKEAVLLAACAAPTAGNQQLYQEAVGHTIGTAQIYYVLQRHKWRKVMPRSQHSKKAADEVIETSKKLTRESQNGRKFSTKFG